MSQKERTRGEEFFGVALALYQTAGLPGLEGFSRIRKCVFSRFTTDRVADRSTVWIGSLNPDFVFFYSEVHSLSVSCSSDVSSGTAVDTNRVLLQYYQKPLLRKPGADTRIQRHNDHSRTE